MYIASDQFAGTASTGAAAKSAADASGAGASLRVAVSPRHLRLVPARTKPTTILGVSVDVATEPQLLERVSRAVSGRRSTVFVGLYASLFRTLADDETYRSDVAASVTYPDGRGVVTELVRRGVADAQRLATTDVVHPIMDQAAAKGWRVGFYGSSEGVAERAAERLRAQHPQLEVVAIWHGYQPLGADDVRAADLDLMLVGLGSGRQERWAHEVACAAGVPAILTCGGLFDFLAGDRRRAPLWMQHAGLEWAFRVLLEPRRLFVRYLLGNGYFLRAARSERATLTPGSGAPVMLRANAITDGPVRERRRRDDASINAAQTNEALMNEEFAYQAYRRAN